MLSRNTALLSKKTDVEVSFPVLVLYVGFLNNYLLVFYGKAGTRLLK